MSSIYLFIILLKWNIFNVSYRILSQHFTHYNFTYWYY
jgi:hypothetical protein